MPHVGRIPSTLEKYRHALSAYLEDITQLNFKSTNSFLYFSDDTKTNTQYLSDESTFNLYKNSNNSHQDGKHLNESSITPIPDTETRINSSYNTVKKQLDLLSSYFSLIHDDLHGDLLLLRTNLNLLPSNTLHIAQRNNNSNNNMSNSSLHNIDDQSLSEQDDEDEEEEEDEDDEEEESKTNYDTSNSGTSIIHDCRRSVSPPTSAVTVSNSDVDEFNLDNILNTKQTQSIQYIVSILQKFIKHNAILVEYIHQNKSKIDSFWVQNNISNHPQIHKLNLDVESIISTMCVKDLIQTKNYSCHNILFHDILGCANTKQFFTRIYFIVSIWYSFFHSLHLCEYHDDCDDDHNNANNNDSDDDQQENKKVKPCNSYLTKLFAMTDFSFLTKSSSNSSTSSSASSSSSPSTTSSSRSLSTEIVSDNIENTSSNNLISTNSVQRNRRNRNRNRRRRQRNRQRINNNTNDTNLNTNNVNNNNNNDLTATTTTSASQSRSIITATSRQSSNESNYNWSSSGSTDDNDACDRELSLTGDSTNSKNDFLLKYLNAQNNYLQSIWHDGIALLEYSLHLLQQQEFRLSCRVAHRCLELFQKQQLEQQRLRHQRQQSHNWNNLNHDLYNDNLSDNNNAVTPNINNTSPNGGGGFGNGLFMVDPITNQPAQIPGLWYIEMHLANCYHTWGQSNMALYHINRTLEQLGNYQINPDSLTVRLNTRRKFKLLSSYLVQSTQRTINMQSKRHRKIRIRSSPKSVRLISNNNDNDNDNKEEKKEVDNDNDNEDTMSPKKITRRRSFMRKIKINNRRRRKSNVFSKLFDRFSGSKKRNKRRKQQEKNRESYNMDDSKSSVDGDNEIDSPLTEWNENALFSNSPSNSNNNNNNCNSNRSRSGSQASRTHSSRLSLVDDVIVIERNQEEDNDNDNHDEIDPDTLNLQLCLEEDLNIANNPECKLSEDTDNEIDDDEELEIEFFNNDDDTDNDDGLDDVLERNGTQMITLEALLSMHMTKGRILIEMKLLREALDLYTYIIDECEALIKYHSLINPHHIQLEREFDQYEEEKQQRLLQTEQDDNMSNNRRRRNRNRRRGSRDNDNDGIMNHHHHHNNHHHHHQQPPPNTPFRRLTKNIGLENYYAARGDIYFKFKDLKNALNDFSNAIKYGKCKKEMGIYYNLRGVCFHEMKQYDKALRDYDNAVKSMYGNHVAWNNRAALLVDMRQYDDAIENANNAIKLDPSYGNAYKHRGVAYHLKCEFEKAITDINRCIKLLPNYRPARLALLAIWKDIFECVRIIHIDEGVPLDLVKICVDYTVGNGYEIDEYMVNFTYC